MVEQRPKGANGYQMTVCSHSGDTGIPHMASFTSFFFVALNSSSCACGESLPTFDALQLYTQLCRHCEEYELE